VLFKSTDRGLTWSNIGPREFDFSLLVMDPTDPKTLFIGSAVEGSLAGDLFLKKTVDGGETWIGLSGGGLCCTLAIEPGNPNVLDAPGDLYVTGNVTDSGLVEEHRWRS